MSYEAGIGPGAAADHEAFAQFVERSQSLVCAVAYSVLGDRALAEEAAQEAFLIAWRSLGAVSAPAQLPAWLCGIVRRVAANMRRKRRWEVTTMAGTSDRPASDSDPLEKLISREDERIAADALAGLAPKYREPLVLFYRGDQSIKEVAAALALSEGAVKQRLSRGRKLLRDSLAHVARTLAATRPGPAFTAVVVGAFVAGRAGAAIGAGRAAAAPKSAGLVGLTTLEAFMAAVALVSTVAVGAVAARKRAASPPPTATSSATHNVPAVGAVSPARASGDALPTRLPQNAPTSPLRAQSAAPVGWQAGLQRRVDLDFGQAPSADMIAMLSDAMSVPILVKGDIAAQVNVRMHDIAAIDALDEILAQAGARRREVPGLRVVARAASPAPLDGGAPVTVAFEGAELRKIVGVLAPALGTPIVIAEDAAPAPITIRFDGTPAGVALAMLLRQINLEAERVAGFEVMPDEP